MKESLHWLILFKQKFWLTPYPNFPGVSILTNHSNLSPSAGVPPEPQIRGLEDWSFIPEQKNITCRVRYFWSENVIFAWELDGEPGSKSPPGYMASVVKHTNNTATFVWALNYTLHHGQNGYKLRCVVRVDNKIHRNYKANDERILFYGMFMELCVWIERTREIDCKFAIHSVYHLIY